MLLIVAGVAAFVVVGAVLFSLGRGGDDGTVPGSATDVGAGTEVTRNGVTLTIPAGWAISDPGDPTLVVAANAADLPLTSPQGPRLAVRSASAGWRDPQDVAAALGSPDPNVEIDVIEDPAEVDVGGVSGVSVTLREMDGGASVIRSYVIVNVDGTNAYQFILEAGEDVWDDHRGTLHTILASAVFEPRAAVLHPTTTAAVEPTDTTTTSSTPTTTTGPGGGFATAEEAIYAAFGYEDSPIMHCNSAESGASNPCYDKHGFFTYLFRPQYGEWYWVLVDEYADGTFTVAETVPVEGEYDFPNPPWNK